MSNKYARIIDNVAVEVIDFNPEGRFHPDVAALFSPVPEFVEQNAELESGIWSNPAPVEVTPSAPVAPVPPTVSAMTFYNLFTVQERIAIKASTDPLVQEFMYTLNLALARNSDIVMALESVQGALMYLTSINLLDVARIPEINTGVPK